MKRGHENENRNSKTARIVETIDAKNKIHGIGLSIFVSGLLLGQFVSSPPSFLSRDSF
jgi:hypothetical protein